jgi:hypothetical protein
MDFRGAGQVFNLIHGLDIARAVGHRWPISRDEALLVIAGVMAIVPEYVNPRRPLGSISPTSCASGVVPATG